MERFCNILISFVYGKFNEILFLKENFLKCEKKFVVKIWMIFMIDFFF